MSKSQPQPDITIRGGLINYPLATIPSVPPRHQPNTPRIKKQTTTRPDYKPPTSLEPPQPDKPTTEAAAPMDPPPDEPPADPPT